MITDCLMTVTPTDGKRYLLAIISAVLLALSFHPIGLHFLAWCALLPLLFAVEGADPGRVFKLGILFGFIFALVSLFWIVFLQIDLQTKILMLVGLIALFIYFGCFFGSGLLVGRLTTIWVLPFIFTALEFVRGTGEIGFPWLALGYSQARYPILIQQTSIIGLYGLSCWLVFLNILIYRILTTKDYRLGIALAVLIVLPVAFGAARMRQPRGEPIAIGIVQPNIDPNLKFTRAMRDETFHRLITLSERCNDENMVQKGRSLDLIIWPETAIPVILTFPGPYQQRVFELVERIEVPLFTGTPVYEKTEKEIYNGAVIIEPAHGITQEYRKVHLVPFGEHIPFDQYIPALRSIDVGGGDYRPGSGEVVFKTGTVTFSCLICFESIFPEISRACVNKGAHFLVNITNDGWFGKLSGPQQHNDMAILRAVENGVPLARCSNTGISMIVDHFGRVQMETHLFEEDIIVAQIIPQRVPTLYTVIGDVIPVLSLLVSMMALAHIFYRKIVRESMGREARRWFGR